MRLKLYHVEPQKYLKNKKSILKLYQSNEYGKVNTFHINEISPNLFHIVFIGLNNDLMNTFYFLKDKKIFIEDVENIILPMSEEIHLNYCLKEIDLKLTKPLIMTNICSQLTEELKKIKM